MNPWCEKTQRAMREWLDSQANTVSDEPLEVKHPLAVCTVITPNYQWMSVLLAISIRQHDLDVPIYVYFVGDRSEFVGARGYFDQLDVRYTSIYEQRIEHAQHLAWSLKSKAILQCPAERCVYIDADVWVRTSVSEWADGRGSLVWYHDVNKAPRNWSLFGLDQEPAVRGQSGVLLVDRTRMAHVLRLWDACNERYSYFFAHLFGDQETLQLAVALLGEHTELLQESVYNKPIYINGDNELIHYAEAKIYSARDYQATKYDAELRRAFWVLFYGWRPIIELVGAEKAQTLYTRFVQRVE